VEAKSFRLNTIRYSRFPFHDARFPFNFCPALVIFSRALDDAAELLISRVRDAENVLSLRAGCEMF
jgi:hypothetical protein